MADQPDLLGLQPEKAPPKAAPCPFCGDRRSLSRWSDWRISCGNCGALGPAGYPFTRAVENWNTRAAPAPEPDDNDPIMEGPSNG